MFSTGEDAFKLTFGTEKQTASDPYDKRAARRMVTRPFSETAADSMDCYIDEIEEDEQILNTVGEWLNRR